MSITLEAANKKLIFALLSALLLVGAIGGSQTQTKTTFNVYEYKVGLIDEKMQAVLENPSEGNIKAVYYNLLEETQWSGRHVSEQSATYEAYLEACNDVLLSLSKGEQPDTSKMESLKNDLI